MLAEATTLLLAVLPVPTLLLTVATLSSGVAGRLSAPLTVLSVLSLPVLSLPVLVLPVPSGLSIAAARCRHGFNLAAQPLHLIERRGFIALCCVALSRLALTHSLLRLLELLAQLLQSLRNLVFRAIRIGIDPAAQPVRRSLHMVVQIGLIHLASAHRAISGQPQADWGPSRVLHSDVVLQLRQFVGELLPLLCKLVAFADQRRHAVHVRRTGAALLAGQLVDAVGLGMLLLRQLAGLARQGLHFA